MTAIKAALRQQLCECTISTLGLSALDQISKTEQGLDQPLFNNKICRRSTGRASTNDQTRHSPDQVPTQTRTVVGQGTA